jgi:hypothetical protein
MKDEWKTKGPGECDMAELEQTNQNSKADAGDASFILHPSSFGSDPSSFEAWDEIEPGRYQPRRIRGSCRGRALG